MLASPLFPVTRSLPALTTTTKSPVSTWGVNSGLCLPRNRRAISAASRPRTLPLASTRYQSRLTSCDLAEKVLMALDSRVRYTTKARDFIEEVAKCQTHFSCDRSAKKSATSKGCAKSTKGGGWRRQNSSSARRTLSARHEGIMSAEFVQCKNILVRCDTKIGLSSEIFRMISKFNSLESDFRSNRSKLRLANTQGRCPLPR